MVFNVIHRRKTHSIALPIITIEPRYHAVANRIVPKRLGQNVLKSIVILKVVCSFK